MSIARAVYAREQINLADDPLASVDVSLATASILSLPFTAIAQHVHGWLYLREEPS